MSVTAILLELAADIPLTKPFQRCKIPHGAELQRIIIFSDASLDVVAFAVYLDIRNADHSSSCNFLFANAYSRHASIPSLEMLSFVIALNELHALILRHSDSLLPNSAAVRIEFKLDSVCTLHSLNVNKLSKSILTKNAKDKMVCNLAQLSKGFNLLIYIGFTSTDTQAADLATKYYEGLVSTVNSHLWRHGSADQIIPLLDAETTYLFTNKGSVTWAGKAEPKCSMVNCHEYDSVFCECRLCDTTFWSPYKALFVSDGICPTDLAVGAQILRPGPNIDRALDPNPPTSHSTYQDVSGIYPQKISSRLVPLPEQVFIVSKLQFLSPINTSTPTRILHI